MFAPLKQTNLEKYTTILVPQSVPDALQVAHELAVQSKAVALDKQDSIAAMGATMAAYGMFKYFANISQYPSMLGGQEGYAKDLFRMASVVRAHIEDIPFGNDTVKADLRRNAQKLYCYFKEVLTNLGVATDGIR